MKLELRHVAPYLPYNLTIQRYSLTGIPCGLSVMIANGFHDGLFYTGIGLVLKYQLKPLLRPLSDLTKEITVNGEKFVPTNEYHGSLGKQLLECSELVSHDLRFAQWQTIEKLFEWDFDVFGLIENDLAIDINTIK